MARIASKDPRSTGCLSYDPRTSARTDHRHPAAVCNAGQESDEHILIYRNAEGQGDDVLGIRGHPDVGSALLHIYNGPNHIRAWTFWPRLDSALGENKSRYFRCTQRVMEIQQSRWFECDRRSQESFSARSTANRIQRSADLRSTKTRRFGARRERFAIRSRCLMRTDRQGQNA